MKGVSYEWSFLCAFKLVKIQDFKLSFVSLLFPEGKQSETIRKTYAFSFLCAFNVVKIFDFNKPYPARILTNQKTHTALWFYVIKPQPMRSQAFLGTFED